MTAYLLDTTVLIDAAREREPGASWLRGHLRRPDPIGVSAITVAEFFAGLDPRDRSWWDAFVQTLIHWDTTRTIALQAGVYRYDAARQGRTIHIPDAVVAATATVVGATLVTSNVRHFTWVGVPILRLDG